MYLFSEARDFKFRSPYLFWPKCLKQIRSSQGKVKHSFQYISKLKSQILKNVYDLAINMLEISNKDF